MHVKLFPTTILTFSSFVIVDARRLRDDVVVGKGNWNECETYRRKKFLLLAWFPDLKTVYHVAGDSEPYVYTKDY